MAIRGLGRVAAGDLLPSGYLLLRPSANYHHIAQCVAAQRLSAPVKPVARRALIAVDKHTTSTRAAYVLPASPLDHRVA